MSNFKCICPLCKKDIPVNHVQQGGMHLGCFNTVIDVWFITLHDEPENGYYEHDINQALDMMKDDGEKYLIQCVKMTAGKYFNLPEFEGF